MIRILIDTKTIYIHEFMNWIFIIAKIFMVQNILMYEIWFTMKCSVEKYFELNSNWNKNGSWSSYCEVLSQNGSSPPQGPVLLTDDAAIGCRWYPSRIHLWLVEQISEFVSRIGSFQQPPEEKQCCRSRTTLSNV